MSFLDTPSRYVRTARTSRDICRDSCAIELPDPPERIPASEIALYVVSVIAAVVVWIVL